MGFQIQPRQDGFFYGISLPTIAENGSSRVERFDMKFRRISRSKINALLKAQDELSESDIEIDGLQRDADYIMEVAEGWRHVSGPDGSDLTFNRDNLMLVLDAYPSAAGAIIKGFIESTMGGGAKRKN